MTVKEALLARFSGTARDHPLFVPGLTVWYERHQPQEALPEVARALDTYSHAQSESAVAKAVEESAGDSRIILGVVDWVPADAKMERLRITPEFVEQQSSE